MQVMNVGKNGDMPFKKGEDAVVIIDQYIDKVTFYRNGVVELSLSLGEPIYIDLDKLSEIYPKK